MDRGAFKKLTKGIDFTVLCDKSKCLKCRSYAALMESHEGCSQDRAYDILIKPLVDEIEALKAEMHKPAILQNPTACKYGHLDCVLDPEYIREKYPEWFEQLYPGGDISNACADCIDSSNYDDEDK